MKISLRWCRDFLSDEPPDASELAALLTGRGFEVESQTPAAVATGIKVGEITDSRPHPQAPRLRVCAVSLGDGDAVDVVCGAPNVEVGRRVAVAVVGATLGELRVAQRAVRGVESAGMICSPAELGVGDDDGGALVFGETDAVAVGDDLDGYLYFNDTVFDVGVTPNRGDCLSHLGMAREIAAATGMTLRPPTAADAADNDEVWPVRIEDSARPACLCYGSIVVRDVNGRLPSPWSLRTLIERTGGRSVSAAVDVTNYVMLAFGQPLHAFDADTLQGGVTVRWGRKTETLKVLDGKTVDCTEDTLLIADDSGAIALGGVMGGADTGINENTRHILLEGAFFSPSAVRGKTRIFGLNSEAAFRFERGVDPLLAPVALGHAAAMISNLCGGSCGRLSSVGAPPAAVAVELRADKMENLLGVPIGVEESARLLNSLHLPATVKDSRLRVEVPSWRFDLRIPVDIVEEIARAWGYSRLPETLPAAMPRLPAAKGSPFSESAARRFFARHGFYEAVSYAFVPSEWEANLSTVPPLALHNPISADMAVMRTTLWGGLLEHAKYNHRHRRERICLFEIGKCFLPGAAGELPAQPTRLAAVVVGQRYPTQWGESKRPSDYYDLKGVVEAFLAAVDVNFEPLTNHPALHPGKAAHVSVNGEIVGLLGELHPSQPIADRFATPPLLFSLDLSLLAAPENMTVRPPSRVPPVSRDVSLRVDSSLPAGVLLRYAKRHAPSPPVSDIRLFDVFNPPGDEDGKIVGLRLTLQEAGLASDRIETVVAAVVEKLGGQFGAILRNEKA